MTEQRPTIRPEGPLNPEPQQLPWWRYLAWLVVLVIFSYYFLNTETSEQQTLSYSEFKISVAEDQVAWVRLQGDQVVGDRVVVDRVAGDR